MVRIQRHVEPVRIAAFGSLHHGFHVLSECLKDRLRRSFEALAWRRTTSRLPSSAVSGVLGSIHNTTRNAQWSSGWQRRMALWGIKNGSRRLRSTVHEEEWQYDARLLSHSRLGFFNLHQCIKDGWPSAFAGPNLFQALLDAGADHTVIAMHEVDDRFDTSTLRALSKPIFFPPGSTVVDLHHISFPIAAKFAARELEKLFDSENL